jgi:hypothetical protein
VIAPSSRILLHGPHQYSRSYNVATMPGGMGCIPLKVAFCWFPLRSFSNRQFLDYSAPTRCRSWLGQTRKRESTWIRFKSSLWYAHYERALLSTHPLRWYHIFMQRRFLSLWVQRVKLGYQSIEQVLNHIIWSPYRSSFWVGTDSRWMIEFRVCQCLQL